MWFNLSIRSCRTARPEWSYSSYTAVMRRLFNVQTWRTFLSIYSCVKLVPSKKLVPKKLSFIFSLSPILHFCYKINITFIRKTVKCVKTLYMEKKNVKMCLQTNSCSIRGSELMSCLTQQLIRDMIGLKTGSVASSLWRFCELFA